jgi:hypothetical protein
MEWIPLIAAMVILASIAGFLRFKYTRFRAEQQRQNRLRPAGLVSALMNLDAGSLDALLALYKEEFGPGPARYARKTLQKWKSGEVQPASQTFERFLVYLPTVMSFDMKCELLRHFMEEYAPKDHAELQLYTDEWEEKLDPLVRRMVDKAFTAQLPAEVERQLEWLGDGDMQAAKKMLRHSQAAEGEIMVSMLRDELETIEKLLAERHLKPKVTHVIKFPYGTINLYVRKRN